jgi:hypothetical protein
VSSKCHSEGIKWCLSQSASTQEGFKTVSLVRLEFLTDDEDLIQLCTLYWQKDAAAFYQRGDVNKQHAANTVVGAIQRQAERALSEGWEVKAYRRDFRCPQSTISQVLFDTALRMGDIGFTQPPRVGAISKFSSNTADVD